jgi:hypothetical protein
MSRTIIINENPKKKRTPDCVIRALKTALNLDAKTIIYELTDIYIKDGWFINDPKCYDKYLKSKGYIKQPQPKYEDGTKYNANEFCKLLNSTESIHGTVLAHVGTHHIVAFVNHGTDDNKDYYLHDSWDSSTGRVGNYWIKDCV